MSILLIQDEITITAVGTLNLLAPNNYIISAFSFMVGEVVATAAGNAAFQGQFNTNTTPFGLIRGQGAATSAGQVLVPGGVLSASNINISFPDFLVLERNQAVFFQTTTFTNITAATIIFNIWGLSTP
jgi:hypothetical protein